MPFLSFTICSITVVYCNQPDEISLTINHGNLLMKRSYAERSARAKSVSVTETPTFTSESLGLPAPSTPNNNANARYPLQTEKLSGPGRRSKDSLTMFVPGIPNGFPPTATRSNICKPLPSPPAHDGPVARKQPLADRSNIQKSHLMLKRRHSLDKLTPEKVTARPVVNEDQYDHPDPRLAALPRPPSGIKLPSLFKSMQPRDSGPESDSVSSDDDHNSIKTNDTAHSVQQQKGMEVKETQKHRAMLEKFKEAITDRWPNITSSGRRRQKRHTVVFPDADKATTGLGVLEGAREDAKRRMAEEQNLGSPKLQRMLDSPRKDTGAKGPAAWQQHFPSGLDDLRSLATSTREIAGFEDHDDVDVNDYDDDDDDPFLDSFEPSFSLMSQNFLDFDFGLTTTDDAAAPSNNKSEDLMDLIDLGRSSTAEVQSSEVSGIGIYGINQTVDHGNGIEPFSGHSIKVSGLYQHPNVMTFSSPIQNQLVPTARSRLLSSTLDRRRRNGIQLAQSPLKKVHTLSDASGQYEYVPDLAILPDGTKFIDITDSNFKAMSDDALDQDASAPMTHSTHPSDASKRSLEEAGLSMNSLPTKKSKTQIPATDSTSSLSLANNDSEERFSFTDDQRKDDTGTDRASDQSTELDFAMVDADSLADEPVIETARIIKQPSASEGRLSNLSRGYMVSLRGGGQFIESNISYRGIQHEEVDELQLPDPRFKLKTS